VFVYIPGFERMTIMRIGKTMYARYWLDELYEVLPEFEDVVHRCRRIGSFEEVRQCATTNIFAQYVTTFTLSPRTIEAGHMLHRISTTRMTQ